MASPDLQPWLEYFGMLQTYKERGMIEVSIEKNEAYITLSALYTLANVEDLFLQIQLAGGSKTQKRIIANKLWQQVKPVVNRLQAYVSWLSTKGEIIYPFALHVVADEAPHDLQYTILVTLRRRWRLRNTNHYEIINYKD